MPTSPSSSTAPPLPAFLTQDRADVHAKFVDLEWQQRERLLAGSQARADALPPSSATTASSPSTSSPSASPWARLSGEAIAARNRYLNVEPFAQNRVKLRVRGKGSERLREGQEDEEEDGVGGAGPMATAAASASDYINASPIALGRRRYIATQGPKDTSISHFYRMLAAETRSPAVVVMLTQTHEAGREKCFQYYPLGADESPLAVPRDDELGDGLEGDVELVSLREDVASRSQVRHLKLRMRMGGGGAAGIDGEEGGEAGGREEAESRAARQAQHQQDSMEENAELEEKDIFHILFAGWPDFLVPEGEDRAALLELIRLSASLRFYDDNDAQPNGDTAASMAASLALADPDNPRIVHCSAGVGRSGTFIALDYLLSLLHTGELDDVPPDKDPIADTVDALRQQRMMMVQGEGQFHFLYDVLREQFEARRKTM